MSGLDPLAAISARVAAAEAAMLEAAINLGVSTEILQSQVSVGDILAAKILPPQNGQDLIEIVGQRVAAQLPPGLHPGETILLQVTGFSGTQIYVQNLGTPDPRNPLPVSDVVLAVPEEGTPPQTAMLRTIRTSEPPAGAPAQPQTPAPQPQTAQNQPPVSPPREVFVAASVRQVQPPPATQTQTPAATPLAAQVQGVEARIAAAQAAKPAPAAAQQPAPAAPAPPAPQKSALAPLIPVRANETASARTVVQRAVQTVSEFLRSARLPDTPFTRMAATIAPQAPERLPSVLQRLEAALPRASDDARVSTLRTLIGFAARLNPANAETLRAQISSYVSNVIEGVEAKLSQLLQAHAQTGPQPDPAARTQDPAAARAPQSPAGAQTPAQQDDPVNLPPALAQARVAERSAAISHDLKSVVLSLLRDPPAGRTQAMTQALSEALVTLTGTQVNALSANAQNPGTFQFTLPVYYHEGGRPAQIRISRDADSRAAKMSADDFHVAFVLDTAHLGTVAVDLQTTGRAVKIEVKTENKASAERFSDTLGSLRTRLEDLRYRVSSTAASALASPAKPEPIAARAPASDVRTGEQHGLDLQA